MAACLTEAGTKISPASFEQKFHVQQAKLGDSVRLECRAQGDQPLKIDWFHGANESSAPLDRNGNEFYEIHETPDLETGALVSYMQLRLLQLHDSQLFRCLARNEFGSSERIIKLIVSSVPERPANLRLRDVWSRSALISWTAATLTASQPSDQAQQLRAGRPTNFTVQFWRKTAGEAKQNHRRESLVVDGLQSSALLANLLPALTYEVSVIAHNQAGQSEPSATIQVTTSEEEPSAPPTDVQAETRGASTIRVMWKVPPVESLNGKLLGFYVGYRPRAPTPGGALLNTVIQQPNSLGMQQQQQQAVAAAGSIFSFKTADAIEGLAYYESFLVNLRPLHEYEITVRAFNKAGSGPDCHVLVARTGSPRLPGAPALQVQRVTSRAVALRWTAAPSPVVANQPRQLANGQPLQQQQQQQHFELFYQILGEHDWYQLSVGQATAASSSLASLQATNEDGQLVGEMAPGQLGDENQRTRAGAEELVQANIHTLSNLQPALTYRIYVAAVNELGLGDPSNVVTIRTSDNSAAGGSRDLGLASTSLAQLDGTGAFEREASAFASSPAGHLLEVLTRPQHGHFYTLLSSLALLLMLVLLVAYFLWQRRLRSKYNSSNASSYPSSWTPAASDTIQSEYSIKQRLPPLPVPAGSTLASGHQLQQAQQQQDLYDEVECVVAQHQQHQQQQHQRGTRANGHLHQTGRLASGKQLRNSATIGRPVLSSHYHQPASLIGPAGATATLQFHPQQHAAGGRQAIGGGGGGQQFKMSATLNRHQNRQLPPIPYSTMTMQKEQPGGLVVGAPKQPRHQGGGNSAAGPNFATGQCGSQTPLIYGPLE